MRQKYPKAKIICCGDELQLRFNALGPIKDPFDEIPYDFTKTYSESKRTSDAKLLSLIDKVARL